MKSKEIGTNIKNARLKRKLSIEEVADKTNLKSSKLEKIENGTGNITTEIIYKLSEILNTKVDTLLHIDTEERDRLLIMYANEKKKEKKRKWLGFIIILIILIIFLLLSYSLFSNRSWAYKISGESENFKYNNSIFIYDSKTYYYMFGTLDFKNENINKDSIVSIRLMCADRLIVGSSNILYQPLREHKGYDEYFPDNVVKNLDDWYFEIEYKDGENIKTEILNLKNIPV